MNSLSKALEVIEYDRMIKEGTLPNGERVHINILYAIKVRENLLLEIGSLLVSELKAAMELESARGCTKQTMTEEKEAIIVRLFDGNSDSTIREYEREAARKILAIVNESFPYGLTFAKELLEGKP